VYLEAVMPQPGAHGTIYDDRQRVDGMQPKHHWKYSWFSKDLYFYGITEQFWVRNENKKYIDEHLSFFIGKLLHAANSILVLEPIFQIILDSDPSK